MKKLVFLVVVAALAFGLLASAAWATSASFELWAGGGNVKSAKLAGCVKIEKVCDPCNPRICVTVTPKSGWTVKEIHVQAATKLEDIPQANGNPVPGQFLGSSCGGPVCVPWPNYPCGGTLIAVHVSLCGPCGEDETGWAFNCFPSVNRFPGANWAGYVIF